MMLSEERLVVRFLEERMSWRRTEFDGRTKKRRTLALALSQSSKALKANFVPPPERKSEKPR